MTNPWLLVAWPRWFDRRGFFKEDIESMPSAPKKPTMTVLPSKAGGGRHNVWIKWPDGHEQHVEFASETEAKLWIENKSEDWLYKHPKAQKFGVRMRGD